MSTSTRRRIAGIALLLALLTLLPLPCRAQELIFQDFYWDVVVPNGHADWWTYTAEQLPALAKAGVTAVWVPGPVKGGSGKWDMGYGPYDYYDLGSKDQKGSIPTRFGTKEEFLRFVAVAHANGIKVYSDAVMNQANGADYAEANPLMAKLGMNDIPDQTKVPPDMYPPDYMPGMILRSWTGFVPKGADGVKGNGRFPRHWQDFHPSPTEPDRDPPYHVQEFGPDYSFNADDFYIEKGMIAWSKWFVAQSDVDGYRLDDLKGLDPYFTTAFTSAAASDKSGFFMVGEYLDGDPQKVMSYLASAGGHLSAFDYPLYFALHDMAFRPEDFSMSDLLSRRMPNRDEAVTFVDNHDMSRSYPIPTNKELCQAVVMAMSGTPCVYYSDFWRRSAGDRARLVRLMWVHAILARGPEIIRESDKNTLVIERKGNLLAGFNSGGDDAAHTLTVPTSFGARVRLIDFAPGNGGKPVVTDAEGRATISVEPFGYVLYGRASEKGLPVPVRPAMATTQTTEFADDLDTGDLTQAPQDVPVTAAKGTALSAIATADAGAPVDVSLIAPDGKAIGHAGGSGTARLSVSHLPATGRYLLRCRTAAGKAHGYLTVTYMAPKVMPG